MKAICLGAMLALAASLAAPQAVLAANNTTVGVGSGAVAGALVGGPVGAVAGAIIGGVVGSSTERAGPRRARRARALRRRAEAAPPSRAPIARSAVSEPAPRSLTPAVPTATGSVSGSTWKNPR
ncbi:hypothetical protein [Methylobacterium soli]|uniref:Glycine zipper domain-containing protein n=1 Tax=Methylobacterium soli TaxID=553447 RepID=A0A6L3SSS7_9HYPH|nr:hypothetical protein [Methylobacterium soli]KAB1070537.1 hypothetical protein F6X53_30035 [Methylobacterium soli]